NLLGNMSWEKRDTLGRLVITPGATFTVSPDPRTEAGSMTVHDNGANDSDTTIGVVKVDNVLLDNYTITETVSPTGYALDPNPTRTLMVDSNHLNAVLGPACATRRSSDLNLLGSMSWEKRDTLGRLVFTPGATFTVSPDP